ncbi:MAG: hypothetical protein QOI66_4310 [Myxococcales bacterium]|nr:hypothetical protein [Myxococcales bacterium]
MHKYNSSTVSATRLPVGKPMMVFLEAVENAGSGFLPIPPTGLSTGQRDDIQGWRRWLSIVLTTLRTVGSSEHRRSILRTALITVE